MLAESHFCFHKAADTTIIGWIMHKYSKYAGFSTGQAGKVTP